MELPKVIASSVIRSAQQGESHGGVYLVDLESERVEQVLDWDRIDIEWEGRGADRGLRGISFFKNKIYLAASDELFVFDRNWSIVESYKNPYLKHCHEINRRGSSLFLTSTNFDSVLEFDLEKQRFLRGYYFRFDPIQRKLNRFCRNLDRFVSKIDLEYYGQKILPRPLPSVKEFDPEKGNGPEDGLDLHINNVHADKNGNGFWVSGTRSGHLIYYNGGKAVSRARIPYVTHNAAPYKSGILANNTNRDEVIYLSNSEIRKFPVKYYPGDELENSNLPKDHARQAFGRGLAITEDDLLVGGSSPATVSVYDFNSGELIKSVNITMDVRNSIHGLEIWPF